MIGYKCLICDKCWLHEGVVIKHINQVHGKENVNKTDYKQVSVATKNRSNINAVGKRGDGDNLQGPGPSKTFQPPTKRVANEIDFIKIKQEHVEASSSTNDNVSSQSDQLKVSNSKLSFESNNKQKTNNLKSTKVSTLSPLEKENIPMTGASSKSAPKKPFTPFISWSKSERENIKKELGPITADQMRKELTKRWAALNSETKQVYQDKYKEETEKYNDELKNTSNGHAHVQNLTIETKKIPKASTKKSENQLKRKKNTQNSNIPQKKQKFSYFEGFNPGNILANCSMTMAPKSMRKLNTETNLHNVMGQSSSNEKSHEVSSASSTVESEKNDVTMETESEVNDVTIETESQPPSKSLHSRQKKRHKSRVRCEDDNCVPCSITKNCNECVFCLNRPIKKQKCEKRQCFTLNAKLKKMKFPSMKASSDVHLDGEENITEEVKAASDVHLDEEQHITEEIHILSESTIKHEISGGQNNSDGEAQTNTEASQENNQSTRVIEDIMDEVISKSISVVLKEKRNRDKATKTKPMIYSCNRCGKGYKQHKSKVQHEHNCKGIKKVKQVIVCEICRQALSDKRSYRRHKDLHKKRDEGEVIQSKCAQCDASFNSKNMLKIHMKNTHGEVNEIDENNIKECPVKGCDFKHLKAAIVKRHITNEHEKNNKDKIKCTICPYECLSRGGLNKHLRAVHTVSITECVDDELNLSGEMPVSDAECVNDELNLSGKIPPEIENGDQNDFVGLGQDSFSDIETENPMTNIDDIDIDIDFNLTSSMSEDFNGHVDQNSELIDPLKKFLASSSGNGNVVKTLGFSEI